jgi:hypothetical protein
MNEALMRVTRRLSWQVKAIGDWAIWSLPRWLTVYVIAIVTVALAAIGVAAPFGGYSRRELALFGLLLVCAVAAVEVTRKAGEQGGLTKDVQGVWELPVAILLPPLYALIAPIVRIALVQWRVAPSPPYRRVFSCRVGRPVVRRRVADLPRAVRSRGPAEYGRDAQPGLVWTAAGGLSVLVKWAVNKAMIIPAVKGTTRPRMSERRFFGGEGLYNDAAEISISCPGDLWGGREPAARRGRTARRHAAAAVAKPHAAGQRIAQ